MVSIRSACLRKCLKSQSAVLRRTGFQPVHPASLEKETGWKPVLRISKHALRLLIALGSGVLLAGCATGPRVLDVSARTYRMTIRKENEDVFVQDRASKLRLPPVPLPDNEQRQEFFVRWTPATVQTVKFEYRQVGLPEKISEQTYKPERRRRNVFTVPSAEFVKGGVVSAWRVSLWDEANQCIGEKKSALW